MSTDPNPYAAPAEPRDKPAAARTGDPLHPRGIGGWLVLPLLGLCLTPVRLVFDVLTGYRSTVRPDVWAMLKSPGSAGVPSLWAFTIVFEVVTTALMLGFTLWALFAFLCKSRQTPRLMIIWYSARAAIILAEMVLVTYLSKTGNLGALAVAPAVGGAALWIPYFLYSERVKNTFVR